MGKRSEQAPVDPAQLVADYKTILQKVLDRRPSGTRQRIASTLGKNRSFVTQICNPSYPTPIPAAHLERIMEICHFSAIERQDFLSAYDAAHPGRLPLHERKTKLRTHTVYLPDLGDEAKNHRLDALVGEFMQRLADIIKDETERS